jgi:hypothetical protein
VHELSHLRHILCLSTFLLLTSYPACDGGRALDYYGAVQPSEGSPEPSEEVGASSFGRAPLLQELEQQHLWVERLEAELERRPLPW